jgi:hypothetical protein
MEMDGSYLSDMEMAGRGNGRKEAMAGRKRMVGRKIGEQESEVRSRRMGIGTQE